MTDQNNGEVLNLLKRIVALLTVQIKRGAPQNMLINELSDAGLEPKQIAEILGTTANVVSVTLHKKKNKKVVKLRDK
jgi:hypothetical protein